MDIESQVTLISEKLYKEQLSQIGSHSSQGLLRH